MSPDIKAHLIQGHELDREYPGLAGAFRRAQRSIEVAVRPFRKGVGGVIPPLLLCDDTVLARDVAIASRESTRENNDKRAYAHYQPIENAIYASREELKSLMTKDGGFNQVTLILAEEVLHALTTVSEGISTRVGFVTIPFGQQKYNKSLQPGKTYLYDLKEYEEGQSSFKEDPTDINLTETATKFALHLMLGSIIPELKDQYPFITLALDEQQPILIPKTPELLATVLQSLVSGDKSALQGIRNGQLLNMLESQNLHIASLSKNIQGARRGQITEDDIFVF